MGYWENLASTDPNLSLFANESFSSKWIKKDVGREKEEGQYTLRIVSMDYNESLYISINEHGQTMD